MKAWKAAFAPISEPGRRRAIARFSWLYLAGFVLYYVLTAWVIPYTAYAHWFFSAYHWPPLIVLIMALRRGVIGILPAVTEPADIFSARFEWTEGITASPDGTASSRSSHHRP